MLFTVTASGNEVPFVVIFKGEPGGHFAKEEIPSHAEILLYAIKNET